MLFNNIRLIGGQWLCERFNLQLVNPLAVRSQVGGRRQTEWLNSDLRSETFQENMRPAGTVRAHLLFHFKHEVVHLELLARTFERCDPAEIEAWVADEPTGEYARRVGFLFEWITGRQLAIEEAAIGGVYVDALDPDTVITATTSSNARRWKVRDNLPGTRFFCPTVRLTEKSKAALGLDCAALINDLKGEFGDDLLMRAAVWLTLRESKSSFQIEGEADQSDRIKRFAQVLDEFTGKGEPPLDEKSLAMLQTAILGANTTLERKGLRLSPVFVGETIAFQETVHYVAPPCEDVPPMLDGISAFLRVTKNAPSVMRCTVASFGFVYVHPLADGNGRVHRFLINDVLRRDGAVQEPLIVPISGLITRDHKERRGYDDILDSFSKPLMNKLDGSYTFGPDKTKYEDGIVSNFDFKGDDDARPAWRFIDFTAHVHYLSDVIERTIKTDMRAQSEYLRAHYAARQAIKEVMEMPDHQADRVLRSLAAGTGALSGALAAEIPALGKEGVWEAIKAAVLEANRGHAGGDSGL